MSDYGHLADESVREFMIAAHQDLERVKTVLAEHPELLNIRYRWGEGNTETPLGAAAHVGNREIAEYLLAQGAPLTICAAATLGRAGDVARFLEEDPAQAQATGAHNIPLMLHVALGGRVDIAQMVVTHGGGGAAALNLLLHVATARGEKELVAWALVQGADPAATNNKGQTPLQVAREQGHEEIAALLAEQE